MRIAQRSIVLLFLVSLAANSFAQAFGKAIDDGAAGYARELVRFHAASVANLLKKSDFEPFAVSFFGWRALTIARLPYNKLDGTHLNICRLALDIYDKELDATLQAVASRPTLMVSFVEATSAEKDAIQKFVVRKYGDKYLMPGINAALAGARPAAAAPKKDETAAWKYELGAALGELSGSVIKWYAFPNNPKYDEAISDLLRSLDKAIKKAPQDAPPELLIGLKQLNAFGSKRFFSPEDRQQIGAIIKQTLLTTLGFAKPLSPALEAIANVVEKAKPAAAAPVAKAPSRAEVANQYYLEGMKKFEARMYDPAIDDFNRSIETDPKPVAYFNRGRTFIYKGMYDRAIADITNAIHFDSLNADDYFYLDYRALALMKKGDLDSALNDLNQSIEFNPRHELGFFLRGSLYRVKGNIAQARADFQAVLRLKPASKEAQDALAALGK